MSLLQKPKILKSLLESDSNKLINWLSINQMQANPDKFQAIALGKAFHEVFNSFKIGSADTCIRCEDQVKLLGADIQVMLNFDKQVTNILCRNSAKHFIKIKQIFYYCNQNCDI